MIRLLYVTIMVLILLSCNAGFIRVAGTSTEVSNGSITGYISTSGNEVSSDTFTVKLLDISAKTRSNLEQSQIVVDGVYKFDSLSGGTYQIKIFHNELEIAKRDSITISTKEKDITVNFVIGQPSHIIPINSEKKISSWTVACFLALNYF